MNLDELARRACRGDTVARDCVGKWLHGQLWEFFARKFPREAVDDLVQDTMVDIWAKAPKQDPVDADAFLSWALSFAGTATRAAKGEVKREHVRARKLDLLVRAEPGRSQSSEVRREQERQLFVVHMWRLPSIYRNALRHRLDGGDDQELAEREGIKAATLRWRISRAIKMLRQLIRAARVTRAPWASVTS